MAETGYRTTLDLAVAVHRSQRRIIKDLNRGRIRADRPGHEWLFTPQQFQLALQYYRGQPGGGRSEKTDDGG